MTRISGWLTVVGLALIAAAIVAQAGDVPYPFPIILLCLGGFVSLFAGVSWVRTRGKRRLKIGFLGMVGFAVGGAVGVFLGEAATSLGGGSLGSAILIVIVGFWFGAILLMSLGIRWGNAIHNRFAADGP